jgi:hypothetical protein
MDDIKIVREIPDDEEIKERAVYLGGERIGTISTGWTRLGGFGWMADFGAPGWTYRSQRKAAQDLVYRVRKKREGKGSIPQGEITGHID